MSKEKEKEELGGFSKEKEKEKEELGKALEENEKKMTELMEKRGRIRKRFDDLNREEEEMHLLARKQKIRQDREQVDKIISERQLGWRETAVLASKTTKCASCYEPLEKDTQGPFYKWEWKTPEDADLYLCFNCRRELVDNKLAAAKAEVDDSLIDCAKFHHIYSRKIQNMTWTYEAEEQAVSLAVIGQCYYAGGSCWFQSNPERTNEWRGVWICEFDEDTRLCDMCFNEGRKDEGLLEQVREKVFGNGGFLSSRFFEDS